MQETNNEEKKEEEKDQKIPEKEDEKKSFPSADEYEALGMKMLRKNKNLKRMANKASELKVWYDYLPKPKEFLVKAGFWSFMLGFAVLSVLLSMWVELNNVDEIRYSGYLVFFWIFFVLQIFKHLLRYNFVTKNINEHMEMLRNGELEKF
jgi:hypothetical protein